MDWSARFPFAVCLEMARAPVRARGAVTRPICKQTSAFAAAVARLKLPPHEVFFGYSYASLEMLDAEKETRRVDGAGPD